MVKEHERLLTGGYIILQWENNAKQIKNYNVQRDLRFEI